MRLCLPFYVKPVVHESLNKFTQLIFASNELFYTGANPNEMRFRRAGCFDVGVQCGGWGHIAMELSVEDRDKLGK